MQLEAGQIVQVRSRQYLVEEVVPPPVVSDDTLVRLSCLEDDAQGDALEVLWEREIDARVIGASTWEAVARRGFDAPRLFSAYLHTLRWNCVTSTNPDLFQAPYRAGIEVKDYQLEPLRKALRMPRVNLFIADDVGLGKTIEAGLILREMLMRQQVRRVVICCPPSVVRQWHDEMEQRFGLTFVIYDRDYVATRRQERGYGVNPWNTHSRFIISQALLRDEVHAAPLRDWLGDFCNSSLLILDEAHNAAPASGARYAIDSKLTHVVRDIAPRFEHRLFLSATPHNGHSNSFAALLEILDPQRFCRGVPVKSPKLLDEVMVRRLKRDRRAVTSDFPERQIIKVVVDGLPADAPELALSHLLQQYRLLSEERLKGASRSKLSAAMLVITSLQKRLLSSIEAFHRTLQAHRKAVERAAETTAAPAPREEVDGQLLLESPGADDERAELDDDEVQAEEDAEMEAATRRALDGPRPLERERALLAQMSEIAARARYQPDSRVQRLVAWIKQNCCPDLGKPGAAWNGRRVLIFTEFTATKTYLQQQLEEAIAGSDRDDRRIDVFHGTIGEERREAIKTAFNMDPARHPLRILIATDAAREGVNLQNHCADLFHFDVPWNPSRMEQRNGRIDRKLQRAPVVRCHYFVLPQRAEDRVLDVLVHKTAIIQKELGSLSPVVERNISRLFSQGIRHDQARQLVASLETVEQEGEGTAGQQVVQEELEEVRLGQEKLLTQVELLRKMLRTSHEWLRLDDRHFRDALSASLEILGAQSLEPLDPAAAVKEPATARWRLPALDERAGADPTWAATLDSLRPPRKPGQKSWEWRKEAPIRPVVFRDPGSLDGDVVHLHLEHRIVQRLLGRFLAQGFLHDELTRACVCRTDDPVPKVLALGRLSLYGRSASRLHDEIVAIAAEWSEPSTRGKSKLRPLGEETKASVLELLEQALASPRLQQAPADLHRRLAGFASQDVGELIPHLDRRARTLAERAEKRLTERGDKEAQAMRAILEAQRERIAKRQKEVDPRQLELTFDKDERRQLEADRRHWDRRLHSLQQELVDEPARIRAAYEVKAVRVEPVGLVYLWPVTG